MELYAEVAGEGQPVVLVHAGICDSRMWDPQWETFPRSHRVLRYDLRGFGRSPLEAGSYSHAQDLIRLIESNGLAPASLVAVSLGGRVALETAVARPELVDVLVLVGSGLPGHDWSDEMEATWAEEEAAFEAGDLDTAVEINLRVWVDGPNRRPEDVDPAVRSAVAEMQRRAFELQLPFEETADEELLVPDLADRLPEIAAPTLAVVGEEDVPDMQAIGDRLAAEIPGATRAAIANAAHVPNLERPAEFDELVLPFLDSVR
ncbi:MAG TPA: alpha/beta fold hydrolase [Gaiellaceae bacterium]|nr:alpha/beta fold hydrolase [Gaiellaceae bacterium]